MKINSAHLFDAIYGAADEAGYLDDLKPIMDGSPSCLVACDLPVHNLTIKCEFDNDYDEAYIFFHACNENERKAFAMVSCPDNGPETYRVMGAAAALMQHVANELVFDMTRTQDKSTLTPDQVDSLEVFAALLGTSAA